MHFENINKLNPCKTPCAKFQIFLIKFLSHQVTRTLYSLSWSASTCFYSQIFFLSSILYTGKGWESRWRGTNIWIRLNLFLSYFNFLLQLTAIWLDSKINSYIFQHMFKFIDCIAIFSPYLTHSLWKIL